MSTTYASEDILTDLHRVQFLKCFNVAALAIFVYDYCLTFATEVRCVWGTKWRMTRIVFTVSRYLPFVASTLTCYNVLVNNGCGSFVLALDGVYTVSIIFAEVILILRTYAIWGQSRKVLILLLFLAAAFIAGSQVVTQKYKIMMPGDSASPFQFFPSLCAYGSSRNGAFQYGFLMAYEIILQSMNSWRKFHTYRNFTNRALNTLYWDGIRYMTWVIMLSGANMSVMAAAPMASIPVLDTAQVAIHSLLASRIFFNLRECDREVYSLAMSVNEAPLESMHYRSRSAVISTQA